MEKALLRYSVGDLDMGKEHDECYIMMTSKFQGNAVRGSLMVLLAGASILLQPKAFDYDRS